MKIFSIALVLMFLATSLEANPARLRHDSKRRNTAKKEPPGYALVDREGKPLPKPFWADPFPEGTIRVEVHLDEQAARVFVDDQLIGQSPISAGRPGFATPEGDYEIIHKREKHFSNLYGSWINADGQFAGEAEAGETAPRGLKYEPAPMPFFIRLTYTGVGFHAGFIPGYPASHGCIRLPKDMAEKFFQDLPEGTPVRIMNLSGPDPLIFENNLQSP